MILAALKKRDRDLAVLSKRFQELLQSISSLPMTEQQQRIEKEFTTWKGGLEQVDDITVIGIEI